MVAAAAVVVAQLLRLGALIGERGIAHGAAIGGGGFEAGE